MISTNKIYVTKYLYITEQKTVYTHNATQCYIISWYKKFLLGKTIHRLVVADHRGIQHLL